MSTQPTTANQTVQEPPSRGRRVLLFLLTYVIAALTVVVIAIAIDAANSPYRSSDYLSAFLLFVPSVMILLPWGVLPALEWISNYLFTIPITLVNYHAGPFPVAANIFASLLVGLSYILLFVMLRAGVVTKRLRTFRLIYLGFLSLVILNAGGCLVHPPG